MLLWKSYFCICIIKIRHFCCYTTTPSVNLAWKCIFVGSVSQSCLTLCSPMDCSPSDSSIHGIFPVKTTGACCHFLYQGDPLDSRIEPIPLMSPWQADSLPLAPMLIWHENIFLLLYVVPEQHTNYCLWNNSMYEKMLSVFQAYDLYFPLKSTADPKLGLWNTIVIYLTDGKQKKKCSYSWIVFIFFIFCV